MFYSVSYMSPADPFRSKELHKAYKKVTFCENRYPHLMTSYLTCESSDEKTLNFEQYSETPLIHPPKYTPFLGQGENFFQKPLIVPFFITGQIRVFLTEIRHKMTFLSLTVANGDFQPY